MSLRPLYLLLFTVILTGSVLAVDSFQHDQTSKSGSSTSVTEEITLPESTNLVLPTMGSSEGALPNRGNQSSEVEYKVVKLKDLEETLDTRIEPNNPLVHDEALQMLAKLSGPGDSALNQTCSIYRYLKQGIPPIKGWIYARDPRGLDYFNYANESIRIGERSCTGVGDCDDFATLMASLVESIGGTTRIILAINNSTGGHAYAEVYLGNLRSQPSQINDTIEWLKQKYSTDTLFTYNDTKTGDVWLNLDWGLDEKGNAHPGGPFFKADKKLVVIVRGTFKKTTLTMPTASENNETLQAPAIQLNITPNLTESNSAVAWFNKGVALGYLGKYDEAIQAYDKAIEIDPQHAAAWNNKGIVLYDQGKYNEALQAYNKSLEIDPKNALVWNNKGNVLKRLDLTAESKAAFDKAVELESEGLLGNTLPETNTINTKLTKSIEASDWFNKGLALSSQGKYKEAIQAYEKAIELDPQNARAWSNKGFALMKLGLTSESKEALDKAKELQTRQAQ